MRKRSRKWVTLMLTACMAVNMVLFAGNVSAEETVLINEDYTKSFNASQLTAWGWSGENSNGGTGDLAYNSGALRIRKTTKNTTDKQYWPAYTATKDLKYTMENYGGNERVTLRKTHFKGIYDLEVDMKFNATTDVSNFNVHNRDAGGSEQTMLFQQNGPGKKVTFKTYECDVVSNSDNSNSQHTYKLRLNYKDTVTTDLGDTKGFRFYLDETQKQGKNSNDILPINATGSSGYVPSYLDKISFSFRNNGVYGACIYIYNIKLTEIEKTEDVTDKAVAALTMDTLTDTPDEVAGALKSLPTTLNGANIEWSSSNPDVISDDGQTVKRQSGGTTDVVMTAKLTNPTDGFTQYLDFRLTVKEAAGDEELVGIAKERLTTDKFTSENVNAITQNLNLPETDDDGQVRIAWSSDNTAVIANDGTVTRPAGYEPVKVTLTATITKGEVSDTKMFELMVPGSNTGTILIDENYATAATEQLTDLGWTEEASLSGNGTLTLTNGAVQMTKTAAQEYGKYGTKYQTYKTLCAEEKNYGSDERVTLRREHFKGVYDLELGLQYTNTAGNVFAVIKNGMTNGTEDSLRFPQTGSWGNKYLSFTNDYGFGNLVTNDDDATKKHNYRFRLNYKDDAAFTKADGTAAGTTKKFQFFLDGSLAPKADESRNETVFPMESKINGTNKPAYLSALSFYFQQHNVANSNVRVDHIKLTELERTADITDTAAAALTMNTLTDTPSAVESALKALPRSVEGVSGVSVTWTSGNTDIISDDGQTVKRPVGEDKDVVMTAKLTNDADGFTQYLDFRLTVKQAPDNEVKVAAAKEWLTIDKFASETADAITQSLTLPSTDNVGKVSITWSSDNATIIANDGTVTRHMGYDPVVVTLTATIAYDGAEDTKTFDLTVPSLFEREVILDEDYSKIITEDLPVLGWSLETGEGNGTYRIENGALVVRKTKKQVTGNYVAAYGVQKDLSQTVANFKGDQKLTLRREQFKGAYDLEIGMTFGNTWGNSWVHMKGGTDQGTEHDLLFVQIGTKGTNTLSFQNAYSYGNLLTTADNTNTYHLYKIRMDYVNDEVLNGSPTKGFRFYTDGTQKTDEGRGESVFPIQANGGTGVPAYLDYLTFQLRDDNQTGATMKINSIKLTELERVLDVTDDALAQMDMSLVTDSPNNVTGALKDLPSSLAGANITWSSSEPDIISDDGKTVNKPLVGDRVVTLTAAVQNPVDYYTQYLDFALTVKAQQEPTYENKVIMSEDYTKGADVSSWTAGTGGNVATGGSGLTITKTNAGFFATLDLKQTIENYNDDARMTVRRSHFRGIYDLELKTAFNNSGQTDVSINGYQRDGIARALASYRQEGSNVTVVPNGETVTTTASQQHVYQTRLDFANDVTFTKGSPTGATKAFKVSADSAEIAYTTGETDRFPMTATGAVYQPEPSYFDTLQFTFGSGSAVNSSATVQSVKLIEQYRAADITDSVLATLHTSTLTDTPEAVTGPLKTLPTSVKGISDVTVTWTSNRPDIISDDGQIFNESSNEIDVIMTAKITSLADGYTQYADFRLTVPASTEEVVYAYDFTNIDAANLSQTGVNVADGVTASVNDAGHLVLEKTTDAEAGDVTAIQAAEFVSPAFDNDGALGGANRADTWINKQKGTYYIDSLIKTDDPSAEGLAFALGVSGSSAEGENPLGANLFFGNNGSSTLLTANRQFHSFATQKNTYTGKWVALRFVVDTEQTGGSTRIFYKVGTETTAPDGAFTELAKDGGIPFGADAAYDFLGSPRIFFTNVSPKGTRVEVASVKVTKAVKHIRTDEEVADAMLRRISMKDITATPEAFRGASDELPPRAVYDYAYYPIEWSSSNPEIVAADGSFVGTDADAGKTVYLNANVKYGAIDKNKTFRLTIGGANTAGGETETALPKATNVVLTGEGQTGKTLGVTYDFQDPDGKDNASEIRWEVSYGSSWRMIIGASGSSYTVSAEYAGTSIRAVVYPKNSEGVSGKETASNAIGIAASSGGTGGGGGGGGKGSGSSATVDIESLPTESSTPQTTPTPQTPSSADTRYVDVPKTHWGYEPIEELSKEGIVGGVGGNVFAPDDLLTREQFAKILSEAFGLTEPEAQSKFADTDEGDWSYRYIATLERYHIVNGNENGEFMKNANITREDIAVMIKRLMDYLQLEPENKTDIDFADSADISDYAKDAVMSLAKAGIVSGDGIGFYPKNDCTRAEAAKIIYGILTWSREGVR